MISISCRLTDTFGAVMVIDLFAFTSPDSVVEIINSHNESDTVLVIAHGGTLFQIISHILDLFPETDDWFSNCSYNELVRINSSAPWQLTMFNGEKL